MCDFDYKDAELLSKVVGAAFLILISYLKYVEKK